MSYPAQDVSWTSGDANNEVEVALPLSGEQDKSAKYAGLVQAILLGGAAPTALEIVDTRRHILTTYTRDNIAAADGGPVASGPFNIRRWGIMVIEFVWSMTNVDTVDLRMALETRMDTGSAWHQIARMPDITTPGGAGRLVRIVPESPSTSVVIAASDLNSASAGGAVEQGAWGTEFQVVSKVHTITGTGPDIDLKVNVLVADR